jgi:glycosyltransferase involved in cell wall biosynthesis
MTPKVSVIIPFRNAAAQLPALVSALRAQTCGPFAEIIWIDDGSRDQGAAWLQTQLAPHWHLLVHRSPRGAYAARNTGLGVAAAENVAFTDVDCRPRPDWIERGLAALAATPRVAGRVEVELSSSPSTAELVDAGRFFRQRRYVKEGFGATANLFVRREVFNAVGYFNDELKSGGDYEFGLRCTRRGIPIAYSDDVVVGHPARATIRELLTKGERVGFGTGQLFRRRGLPVRLLAARAMDRFSLARRTARTERTNPDTGGTNSLTMTGLHALILLATIAGSVRGVLWPRTQSASTDRTVVRMDVV